MQSKLLLQRIEAKRETPVRAPANTAAAKVRLDDSCETRFVVFVFVFVCVVFVCLCVCVFG